METEDRKVVLYKGDEIGSLVTLEWHWGGLIISESVGDICLVRQKAGFSGAPGPTLCGKDRFAKGGPGWSLGGGTSGPGISHTPCAACAAAATKLGLPIGGNHAPLFGESENILKRPYSKLVFEDTKAKIKAGDVEGLARSMKSEYQEYYGSGQV